MSSGTHLLLSRCNCFCCFYFWCWYFYIFEIWRFPKNCIGFLAFCVYIRTNPTNLWFDGRHWYQKNRNFNPNIQYFLVQNLLGIYPCNSSGFASFVLDLVNKKVRNLIHFFWKSPHCFHFLFEATTFFEELG